MSIRNNEQIFLIGGYGQHIHCYDECINYFDEKLNSKLNLSGIDFTSKINMPLSVCQNLGIKGSHFRKFKYLTSLSQEEKIEEYDIQLINLLHASLLNFLLCHNNSSNLSIICHSVGLYILKLFIRRLTSLSGAIPPKLWSSKVINIYSFGGYDRRIIGDLVAFNNLLNHNNTGFNFLHYAALGITQVNSVNASRFFKRYCSELYGSKSLLPDCEYLGDGVIPYSRNHHNKDVVYLKDVQHANLFGKNHYFSFSALDQWYSVQQLNSVPTNSRK